MTHETNRSKTHSLIHVEPIQEDYLDITDYFTSKFDYTFKSSMYRPHKNTLAIYDLFRQIMGNDERNINTPIVTLSPDSTICASTIAGGCERFMYTENDPRKNTPTYRSNMKVIYINSVPALSTKTYANYQDFTDSVLADVMGLTESSFSLHRVDLEPENLFLVGIDEDMVSHDQLRIIEEKNIDMYSLQLIKRKGVKDILEHIVEQVKYDDVHIVFDLSSISQNVAPSVYRNPETTEGFDTDQVKQIVSILKNLQRIYSVDIVGYNFGPKSMKDEYNKANMITTKIIQDIVCGFVDLKKKSINFFDEESRFLIWKRIDDEELLGWKILRGVSLEDREEFIQMIGDDRIITVIVPDGDEVYDAFVTVTTMKEQQEKTYYLASSVYDCCLYPGEKISMMFELLNTPSVMEQITKEAQDILEDEEVDVSTDTIRSVPLIAVNILQEVSDEDSQIDTPDKFTDNKEEDYLLT